MDKRRDPVGNAVSKVAIPAGPADNDTVLAVVTRAGQRRNNPAAVVPGPTSEQVATAKLALPALIGDAVSQLSFTSASAGLYRPVKHREGLGDRVDYETYRAQAEAGIREALRRGPPCVSVEYRPGDFSPLSVTFWSPGGYMTCVVVDPDGGMKLTTHYQNEREMPAGVAAALIEPVHPGHAGRVRPDRMPVLVPAPVEPMVALAPERQAQLMLPPAPERLALPAPSRVDVDAAVDAVVAEVSDDQSGSKNEP